MWENVCRRCDQQRIDGEALYSQQKQDWELTVTRIMNSLLPNSDLNWRNLGKALDYSGMT